MRGGLKQEIKKRVQNFAGIREAIRSLRTVRSEVDRLHRRLDAFDHRQHVIDRAAETLARIMPDWQSAVFRSPDGNALLSAEDLRDHADRINLKLSVAVYGGLGKATRDLHPRHVAFMAPGTTWFANSSVLARQAGFGRRAILGTLVTRPECMHHPAKSFCSRVQQYTERRATPAA